MNRFCAVCGLGKAEDIYKQGFLPIGGQKFSYRIVSCKNCGFNYATSLPNQKKLELFYKKNNKYAYQHNHGQSPSYMKKFYLNSFTLIDTYLKKNKKNFYKNNISVLDIGCANGYLLSIFRKKSYKNLTGIDPAPECRIAAKKLYDLKIKSLPLSEFRTREKFDVVVFSSVLEHISDLNKALLRSTSLLKDGGLMFVSVPDGNNFGKILNEPFLEFSLEHINYFTRSSLTNLLSKYGLANNVFESYPLNTYGGYALNSLWIKNGYNKKIIYDSSGKRTILKYITKSKERLASIESKINKLVESKNDLIIWGVGSLTSRLLATTRLAKANIKYFVDSNRNLQGKNIMKWSIKSPKTVYKSKLNILVSSFIFFEEIKNDLLKNHFKGKIISL